VPLRFDLIRNLAASCEDACCDIEDDEAEDGADRVLLLNSFTT
jgi:hypothetical protein